MSEPTDIQSPPETDVPPPSSVLVVCPSCHYGFPVPQGTETNFICPRPECSYHWEALTRTVQAVHQAVRRKAIPELRVVTGAPPATLQLQEGEVLIGRDPRCNLVLDNLNVSRRHARLIRQGDRVYLEDLNSQWGTQVNGVRLVNKKVLSPRDEVVLGGVTLRFEVRFEAMEPKSDLVDNTTRIALAERAVPTINGVPADVIVLKPGKLTFGRVPNRDVVLPDGMISRRHAVLEYRDGAYYLADTQSQIGTYVNGKGIIRVKLEPGDRIQMGPYLFRFDGGQLTRIKQPGSLDVVAVNLSKSIGPICLLDEISLALQPGEFVGLLGPSGCGKTTLLDALNGSRPARSGQVYINGEPLYEQYERLRHLIGYVPQHDNIHRELTCRQALFFAARIRLPPDASDEELARLVEETLSSLDLTDRADVTIGQLSGGQRKRANVGVELLSKPGILFLDEPTAGLDPSTESRLMRKFKQLASQGRTVVCTTHVMENVDLFDKVAILAPGGRLAYFGPPDQAKRYFGIDRFTLLYEKLEEKKPEEWKQKYLDSPLHRELLASAAAPSRAGTALSRRRRPAPAPPSSPIGQWTTLVQRFSTILWADKQFLGVLAGQAVVIAILICLVSKGLPMNLFLLAIAAFWFGCGMAAQQLVRERPIYRRERMVNLRLDCYLFSKFVPLAFLSFLQSGLMLAVVYFWPGREYHGNLALQLLILTLTGWNGVTTGLIISSLAANADKATSVVPLTVLPQIILAGALIPLPDMTVLTRTLSYPIVARWANQALEITLLQGRVLTFELMQNEAYRKALWNQYPNYNLRDPQSQQELLSTHKNKPIERRVDLTVALAILVGFLIVHLSAVFLSLRWQDAFSVP